MGEHYTRREFEVNGVPFVDFKCNECPAAYVNEETTYQHWRTKHGPKMIGGRVLDASGRQVMFEKPSVPSHPPEEQDEFGGFGTGEPFKE